MFAVMGLFGFVALAIDTSMWYSTKRRMQTAADAAARAGAYELLRITVTADEIAASAKADAAKYGFTAEKGATVQIVSNKTDATVETSISMPASLNFARLFLAAAPVVATRAVASAPQSPPPCLTLLEPSAPLALDMSGGTRVSSPSCRLQVNSTDKEALKVSNNSYIDAAQICVSGGATGSGTSVPIEKGCPALMDPLSFWMPPVPSSTCTYASPVKFQNQTAALANSGMDVFCGGIEINAATVTLGKGIYVLKNSALTIVNKGSMLGDGVAFLLLGTSTINIADGTKVKLSAPVNGPMAGMVFAHERDAPIGLEHKVVGADVSYEGAIYLPKHNMTYSSKTVSSNIPPFTTFIVRRMKLDGGANLVLNNNYAASEVPVAGKIGSGVVLSQ